MLRRPEKRIKKILETPNGRGFITGRALRQPINLSNDHPRDSPPPIPRRIFLHQNKRDNMGAIHSTKIQTCPTGKRGPPQKVDQFFRNFRLDQTDPLSFGPKFPEILVEWIVPCGITGSPSALCVSPGFRGHLVGIY